MSLFFSFLSAHPICLLLSFLFSIKNIFFFFISTSFIYVFDIKSSSPSFKFVVFQFVVFILLGNILCK